MLDFLKPVRRRHWIDCSAVVSPGGVLVDGNTQWGLSGVAFPVLEVPYTWALVYIPPRIATASPLIGAVDIYSIDCVLFMAPNESFHTCLTQSGVAVLSGTSAVAVATALPPSGALGLISPTGVAVSTDTSSTLQQAFATGGLLTGTSIPSPRIPVVLNTALPNYAVFGAATPVPIPTTGVVTTTGSVTNLVLCSDISNPWYSMSLSLYVSQFNEASGTWEVYSIDSVPGRGYDFLDYVVDFYSPPVVANSFTSRSFRVRLPCPIRIGQGQGLFASYVAHNAGNPVVPYIRSQVSKVG